MNGIKIFNKFSDNPNKVVKDYDFNMITEVIANEIQDLYWILNRNVIFNNFSKDGDEFNDYQEKYDELILYETDLYRLTQVNFILKYSKFIMGDWDNILGIQNKTYFEKEEHFNYDFIINKTNVFFRCVDGLYWEVYTNNSHIIELLSKEFPHSEQCLLDQKEWL